MEASLRRSGESDAERRNFLGWNGKRERIWAKTGLGPAFCEWYIAGYAVFRLREEMAEKGEIADWGCGQRLSQSPGLMNLVQRAFRARLAMSSLAVLTGWIRRSICAV